jgi:hypothetical protein
MVFFPGVQDCTEFIKAGKCPAIAALNADLFHHSRETWRIAVVAATNMHDIGAVNLHIPSWKGILLLAFKIPPFRTPEGGIGFREKDSFAVIEIQDGHRILF